ncbi:glycosyltransferase [Streptococcus parauberis]|uniref:glycosyltransferase n=1 Tax=Streptococcus parauberis TaxID=1348 RepID=UPI000C45EB7A|nr:glycosyltransferase [Streptococcus parauberis]PIO78239.1 UDP-Glc:alpha-D-GlcNAc-diphosphoundecaprenol beta-1,3-glucosyltransferase WfgD [Streptococcus parauberis]POS67809.1 UDP-Glc:alpha-D-GlcNAc-diphosphoundecaprenol beta-1,3-glucosyltransferase WfgD [Streptococcus parauberis]
MVKRIAVAMSTYNGEKYLTEQIESVLSQSNVDITLFIRDDMSSDKTKILLETFRNKVIIIDNQKTNLGVGNSFMDLLYAIGSDFDYYAFCDQDDVWLSNKVESAVEVLTGLSGPQLYCSNQTVVNEQLKPIRTRHNYKINTSYLQIVNNNKITGCTMLWNQELQKILIEPSHRPKKELLQNRIHDVWVSLVASLVGQIHYDTNSYILYRQHENNVVGVKKVMLLENWKKKLNNKSKRNGRSMISKEALEKLPNLISDRENKKLTLFATYRINIKNKIHLLQNLKLLNGTGESQIALLIKVLFNLI